MNKVTEYLLSERMRWPDDAEIRRSCVEGRFYRARQRDAFYVLKRIAYHLEGKERPTIRRGTGADDYSIEHILPQSITEEWVGDLTQWGDDAFKTWQERKDVIGNLTLTAYNSDLGQLPFHKKKSIISDNMRLQLSQMIVNSDRWTREAIDSRSSELAELAISIWRKPSNPNG